MKFGRNIQKTLEQSLHVSVLCRFAFYQLFVLLFTVLDAVLYWFKKGNLTFLGIII